LRRLPLTILILFVLCGGNTSWSQQLTLFNVNTTSWPIVSANYVAFSDLGERLDDLTERDFRVVENTVDGGQTDLSSTVRDTCITTSSAGSVTVMLIIDESQSMSDILPGGTRRLDYVKAALRAFVERLVWNGETSVAIIGFSGKSRTVCDWQTSPGPVLAAIDRIQPLTATNYEVAFDSDPNVFDMMQTRSPSIPKVAFFITDGEPNPEIKDRESFTESAINRSRAQGIRFYSVTLLVGRTDPSIATICTATGGRSIVAKEEELVNLVSVLALETTSSKLCSITWLSPMVCTDIARQRTAVVQLRRGRQPDVRVSYTTPPGSVYDVRVDKQTLVCGDPPANGTTTATVTLTAGNSDVRIQSAVVSAPDFFSVEGFTPFTLRSGESRTLTIRFTQGAQRIIRQGVLSFVGSPTCLPSVTLIGGGGSVIVVTPNGDEILTTCDTTKITWTGVPAFQPVDIEFSCDNGPFVPLAQNVTGSSYSWLPDRGCATGRIRIRTRPEERFQWARRLGGPGTEDVGAIATVADGSRVFVGGWHVGQTEIGTTTSNAPFNASDGYVAEFAADGTITNVTFLRGVPGSNERVVSVRTDRNDNLYIAGYIEGESTFGDRRITMPETDRRIGFLEKLSPEGTLIWRYTVTGNGFDDADIDLTTLDLRDDAAGRQEVVIIGTGLNTIAVRSTAGVIQDEIRTNPFIRIPWSVTIGADDRPRLQAGTDAARPSADDPRDTRDALGFRYVTRSYQGRYNVPVIPPVSLENRGLRDVAVVKSALGIETEDVSDRPFTILSPVLSTTIDTIFFDPTGIGRTVTITSPHGLLNSGTQSLLIDSVVISGAHPDDFTIVTSLDSMTLDVLDSITLEASFSPVQEGRRTAIVTIYGGCGNVVSFVLVGLGRPECPWTVVDTTDVGRVIVGSSRQVIANCILRSERRVNVSGTITISGSPDFTVTPMGQFTLRYGDCVNLRITYSPTFTGPASAQIDFNLPVECGVAFTQVFGEGILPSLSVDDVDFGNRRLQTIHDSVVTVVNNGNVDVVVASFRLVDTASTGITATLPPSNTVIAAGASLDIPVRFTPRTRPDVAARILIDAEGIDSQLVATIRGRGYLPVLNASGYSFTPVFINTTSPEQGFVRLTNSDTEWPLHIDNVILINAGADFDWRGPLRPLPLDIPPGESIDLPVAFTPRGTGRRQTIVVVSHDGKPGPGDIPPYTTDTVIVEGIGLQRSVIPPINLGTILSCRDSTTTIQIVNDDPLRPLTLSAATSSGDINELSIETTFPIVIAPGESVTLTLRFSPRSPGIYAATYTLQNAAGLDLVVQLVGRATSIPMSLVLTAPQRTPLGATAAIGLDVGPLETSPWNPTAFHVKVSHDAAALNFRDVVNVVPGWTYTTQPYRGGVDIDFVSTTGQPWSGGKLADIQLVTYLTADEEQLVSVHLAAPESCLRPDSATVTVLLDLSCYTEGRLLQFSGATFSLQAPNPNPVHDKVALPYSMGISGNVQFDLVDITGQPVRSVQLYRPAGAHELLLDLTDIAPGVYHLRMITAAYRTAVTLVR